MMVKGVSWEIPSSIDLAGFLKKHPPDFKYKIDHFYFIIDYICKGMEREDLDGNRGFINLNAQKLQKANHSYKKYIDHLLKHRFLKTDMKYIVGKKSSGFMINGYLTHKSSLKQIDIKDLVCNKKQIAEAKEQQKELKEAAKIHPHLTQWFNEKLQIDVQGAEEKVEELFPVQTGPIRGKRKGKASRLTKRYKAIQSIHKFANQEFYYGVDENVGRFHSNLTNIKRELRHYITYDGQKLVNVDIKSAQPLFSTLLLDEAFWNKKGELLSINHFPSIIQLLSISSSYSISSTIIMLVKTLQRIDNKLFNQYLSFVHSGEFYKKISELFYPQAAFDKQKMKKMVYTVFFSSNKYMGQVSAKPKRDFKAHFPEVYEIFRLIKKNNHRALAHILQRIESTIMIQHVAKRIAQEKPELPIFTIHDSIATIVGNEDYLVSVIQNEIAQLTGLKASLGTEYWD